MDPRAMLTPALAASLASMERDNARRTKDLPPRYQPTLPWDPGSEGQHYVFEVVLEDGTPTGDPPVTPKLWTVRDMGVDTSFAGYIIPRTGSPIAVSVPTPAAVTAGKVYIKIPLTDTGDYDAASATIEYSADELDEFTETDGESVPAFRNLKLAEIITSDDDPPVLTVRQSWTGGDVHPVDEYGIDKEEVTVYDQVTTSDSDKKIIQKVRKAKLDVVDGKIKLVYTDDYPETVDVIEIDDTPIIMYDKVDYDVYGKKFTQLKYSLKLDIVGGKLKIVQTAGSPEKVDVISVDDTPVNAYAAVTFDASTLQLKQAASTVKLILDGSSIKLAAVPGSDVVVCEGIYYP